VLLYCVLELDVFVFFPFTDTFTHLIDAGIQDLAPSIPTLHSRPTWNQRGNSTPILATELLYSIHQLDVFGFFPVSRTSIHSVDAGIEDIAPSITTLSFRPTRN
jgi:hypothetical protein